MRSGALPLAASVGAVAMHSLHRFVVQRRIAGYDAVNRVDQIEPAWVQAYIDDLGHGTTHLYEGDIQAYAAANGINLDGVVFANPGGNHWNVTIPLANHTNAAVTTRADGNCAIHALHACQYREAIAEPAGYAAPADYVETVRAWLTANPPDGAEIRARILARIQHEDTVAETGFGPALAALLRPREIAAHQAVEKAQAEAREKAAAEAEAAAKAKAGSSGASGTPDAAAALTGSDIAAMVEAQLRAFDHIDVAAVWSAVEAAVAANDAANNVYLSLLGEEAAPTIDNSQTLAKYLHGAEDITAQGLRDFITAVNRITSRPKIHPLIELIGFDPEEKPTVDPSAAIRAFGKKVGGILRPLLAMPPTTAAANAGAEAIAAIYQDVIDLVQRSGRDPMAYAIAMALHQCGFIERLINIKLTTLVGKNDELLCHETDIARPLINALAGLKPAGIKAAPGTEVPIDASRLDAMKMIFIKQNRPKKK